MKSPRREPGRPVAPPAWWPPRGVKRCNERETMPLGRHAFLGPPSSKGAATASTGPPTCCSPGRGAGARDEPEAFSTMPRRFNEGIERIDGRPWPRDRPLV